MKTFNAALLFTILLAQLIPGIASATSATGLSCEIARPPRESLEQKLSQNCSAVSEFIFESEADSGGTAIGALWGAARCLQGIGLGVKDYVMAVPHMIELMINAFPVLKEKAVGIVEKAMAKSSNPIQRTANIARANFQVSRFLWNVAVESYDQIVAGLKEFVSLLSHWMKKEWRDFFCLPPSLQSKVLCRIIFDVMPIIMSPTALINKSEWAKIILKELSIAKKIATKVGATPVLKVVNRFTGEHDAYEGIKEAFIKLDHVARVELEYERRLAHALAKEEEIAAGSSGAASAASKNNKEKI